MARVEQVVFLASGVAWFGSHTGEMAMLPHLSRLTKLKTIVPRKTLPRRFMGKLHSMYRGWPPRNQHVSFAELQAWMQFQGSKNTVLHVLRSEEHSHFLSLWDKLPKNIVNTIHLPVALWSKDYREAISRLSSAIVYFTSGIEKIGSLMGQPNIKFIHNGVDTDFFKPDLRKLQTPPRILYSGVYLRNEPMLVRVVKRLAEKMPDLRFDLLVPAHHRKSPALAPLLEHPAITWHGGLNDEELCALYQRSYLVLLPMNESGANTAVVEALASGLPLVTTDVGGIRDYGGGTVFPTVANNDDDAMVELVGRYLSKPNWRDDIGLKSRQFAEDVLAWPLIAARHLKAYQELSA